MPTFSNEETKVVFFNHDASRKSRPASKETYYNLKSSIEYAVSRANQKHQEVHAVWFVNPDYILEPARVENSIATALEGGHATYLRETSTMDRLCFKTESNFHITIFIVGGGRVTTNLVREVDPVNASSNDDSSSDESTFRDARGLAITQECIGVISGKQCLIAKKRKL